MSWSFKLKEACDIEADVNIVFRFCIIIQTFCKYYRNQFGNKTSSISDHLKRILSLRSKSLRIQN